MKDPLRTITEGLRDFRGDVEADVEIPMGIEIHTNGQVIITIPGILEKTYDIGKPDEKTSIEELEDVFERAARDIMQWGINFQYVMQKDDEEDETEENEE